MDILNLKTTFRSHQRLDYLADTRKIRVNDSTFPEFFDLRTEKYYPQGCVFGEAHPTTSTSQLTGKNAILHNL